MEMPGRQAYKDDDICLDTFFIVVYFTTITSTHTLHVHVTIGVLSFEFRIKNKISLLLMRFCLFVVIHCYLSFALFSFMRKKETP
jgi:hypothetical protein